MAARESAATVKTLGSRAVRLIEVRDTREWLQPTPYDRPRPIRGSGDAHRCDHCGAPHEIHCFVRLEDGSEANIGSSCLELLLPQYSGRVSPAAMRQLHRARPCL